MVKTSNSPFVIVYYISTVLLMLSSMGISWLWSIPYFLFVFFAFLTTLLSFSSGIFNYDFTFSKILLIYIVIAIILTFLNPNFSLFIILQNFAHAIVIVGVIILKDCCKIELFNWFVKVLSLILLITIPAWLFFLAGYHFSHGTYVDIGDGFHFMKDYTFFVVSDVGEGSDFLRFSSVFMEPGWIGTLCCFTIFGMSINLKRLPTWLCLLGLLLSMSLSAVVNLLICLVLWIWQTSKHRVFWLCFFVASLIGITLFAVNYKKGNNAISRLVIERLIFDEDLGIAGNNRTNDEFDYKFEEVISGSDKWFGIGHEINKEFMETNDWYNRSSGIKKELMDNGYVGTGLYFLLLVLLLIKYRSKSGFVFFVCFILASFIRNKWRDDCYLVLYIVALCTLYIESQSNLKVIESKNARVIKK